ncbi:2-C-methyl-D-erythritol 2,4-cyclodiphosphate synthase [Candidatus Vallotia lariciata]|uniref:2-C-methyl-D-erythritol 2,4-cyclodiphosphate synthase n=1 Tax=Candidatus Vallotia laricis TaxID=2018052 RepID=UPI001D028DCB|nr:2-C-methyl-D-erythritol 2,4-cyclodiphosphate synthase [Candidatus Vallotia lariciata]UDG83024.1 2-C-methyl-D-erythritol 2,4-cyclodiphosphate synthase [Candidatus Vallotia lariciata]
MNWRIGQGYDVHKLIPGRPLVIGGMIVPYDRGLLGYSDADVLLHAITDALLGGAALGDIGRHFPNEDRNFSGANSRDLMREAARRVAKAGFYIVNVDSTVIAQQPKLSKYIPSMRGNIAIDLDIHDNAINIKAKTNENLGYIGRGEAVEAQAVVLLTSR